METVVGFDIETTGLDHKKNAVLSIGVAWKDPASGCYKSMEKVLNSSFSGTHHDWSAEAYLVNQIDPFGALSPDGLSLEESLSKLDFSIFNSLCDVIRSMGLKPKTGLLTPTGWNVYGFDMRFMSHYFPNSASLFKYSSVAELNTMAKMLSFLPFAGEDVNTTYTKGYLKDIAKQKIDTSFSNLSGMSHNARHDALESIIIYDFIIETMDNLSLYFEHAKEDL